MKNKFKNIKKDSKIVINKIIIHNLKFYPIMILGIILFIK